MTEHNFEATVSSIIVIIMTILGWVFKSISNLRFDLNKRIEKVEDKVDGKIPRSEVAELISLHINPIKKDIADIGRDVRLLLLKETGDDGTKN